MAKIYPWRKFPAIRYIAHSHAGSTPTFIAKGGGRSLPGNEAIAGQETNRIKHPTPNPNKYYAAQHLLISTSLSWPTIGEILRPLLNTVLKWLDTEIVKGALQEAWNILQKELGKCLGSVWKDIIREGVKWGVDKALSALRAVKEKVTKFCRENEVLIEQLTKLATKTGLRTIAAKVVTKQVAKVATKESAKAGSKLLVKVANPLGIVADVAQAGLEVAGMEETGKKVGKYGNIASGVMIGAAVGGPPGAVFGAVGGFAVWGVGEIVGGLIGMAIGD